MSESTGAAGRAGAAMIGATLLWGATFVVIRDSLHHVTPTTLVATRFAIAAPILGLAAWVARRRSGGARAVFRPSLWRAAAVVGVVGAASYLLQAIGLMETSAGSSAFLTCAGSLVAGLLAWPLLRQRPSRVLLAGIALAGAGAALMSQRPLLGGDAWTLVGALGFGVQVVAIARWAPEEDPLALTAAQCAVAALVLLPFGTGARAELAGLDRSGWIRLGYLVIAGTVIAPMLQVFAQRTVPAGRVGLWFALEPVFALLFALGLGGERFGPRWWIGAGLIVFAVTWVESLAARAPASSRATT